MAKATVSLILNHTTDAGYRVWGQQMNTFLGTTIALTQTSDTGQVNWTTITRPGAGTYNGYEMYRLNDSAQSTAPLYIKVEYGTSSGGTGRSACKFSLGEGANGTGTLTGATWNDLVLFNFASDGSTQALDLIMNWNSTVGYLGMFTNNAVYDNPSNGYPTFSFERLRTITGTPSTRGFAACVLNSTAVNAYRTLNVGAYDSATSNSIPLFWPWRSTGAASAGGTFVSGLTPLTGNGTHGPLEKTLGLCGLGAADASASSVFSVTRWDGNVHSYITTRSFGSANMNSTGVEGNCRHAILWD
jgi:hypothetical protein